MRPLCIYHANCVDGFASAWVVNRFFNGEVEFFAAKYGSLPPAAVGRHVIIVDFSYPADTLKLMGDMSLGVLVLDHHKTAQEMLAEFVEPMELWTEPRHDKGKSTKAVRAHFDMNRSGAGMTWDYFFRGVPRPMLVDLVEDRDLWRFKKIGTREIHSLLTGDEMTFQRMTELNEELECNSATFMGLIDKGAAIDRAHLQKCKELIEAARHMINLDGNAVPCCNAPTHMASDVGNMLCQGWPFAVTYWDRPDGKRSYSLRSTSESMDVGEIAKRHGGGGHRNAAGFEVTAPKYVFE